MPPRKVTKQTSARVSRIGAKLLAKYKALGVSGLERDWYVIADDGVKWRDVAALAGSVVSQDETPRKVAKRGKRG
jgi:hypothetical protein